MDWKNGVISIDDITFSPGFSFGDFKNTSLYSGQDGVRMIYLDKVCCIDNNRFKVSIMFRNGMLYLISLYCVDIDIPYERESERKLLHDSILKDHGLSDKNYFSWGSIESSFDPRSFSCSLNIVYK